MTFITQKFALEIHLSYTNAAYNGVVVNIIVIAGVVESSIVIGHFNYC